MTTLTIEQTTENTGGPARTFSPSLLWLLTAGSFYAFFIFGFIDNLKGPTLPPLLRDVQLSYSQGGAILLAAYLGFMVATLVTGVLADSIGNKRVLALAGLFLTVGLAAFSLVSSFWLLALALFVVGLGLGSIEVGGNSLVVELHSRARGRFLNLLAVFHGVGSLLVPLFAAQLLTGGFSWRQVYQFSIILAIGLLAFFLVVRYPQRAGPAGQGVALGAFLTAGFTLRMSWYYLLVAVYVAAELGIAAWIVEYLQQVKGFSLAAGSLYLSLFFAAIMVGRLVGSFIVERIGYLRILLVAALAASVCLAIGIFGPPSLVFCIPLAGLFFSIMFPTTTASVSTLHMENTSAILGVLFAFGGLGGALGPWSIGVAADIFGIQWGFALNIVFCLVMLAALLALRRMGRE